MRILVAYDASEYADFMVEDLRHAGLPEDATVLVLSVADGQLSHPDIDAEASEGIRGEENVSAERAAARLAARFPSWSIRAEALGGSPVKTIIQRARDWNADLITLGSPGHTALERILTGSVSYKVANEAPCSVRICRSGGAAQEGKLQILVGYDGMPGSQSAVRTVAGRRWPKETTVTLLTVVGFGYSPVAQLSMPEDHSRARLVQQPAERILLESGLRVSTVVVEDDPKIAIVERASLTHVDSIFIGHNDHRLVYRLFLGTVASTVVPRAPCSVEIVRPQR